MALLIQLKDLHKAYGPLTLLDQVNVAFADRQRVGCVGRNGAGKTTLLRIITGEEQADAGTVQMAAGLKLAYLEQQDPFRPEETVMEYLVRQSGRESWQCGKLASRFRLKGPILDSPVRLLSGGYQTRVKLAAMLAAEPGFLLLDEPTNYLDLSTLILLENFLEDFEGGALVVSHDREFLKRSCDHTLDIENGRVELYPGDVETWLEQKALRREQAEAWNKNVDAKRRQLQRFVDRFRAKNTKATQAQSKLKQIARLKTIKVEHPMATARIRMPGVTSRKGWALRCEGLAVGYPGREVASDIHLEVDAGERIAVLGDNGQGKTTLLRTLAGNLPALGGGFRWADNLDIACFAQHVYEALGPEETPRSWLTARAAPEVTRQQVLDMAGSFLFRGDDVDKPASVLSGGERARVCLAGLLLAKSNVLLLDEPTNHLDFETVEALGAALRGFGGTIFFTSHDRTFASLVATGIAEIREGRVVLRRESYQDYVDRLERETEEDEGDADAGRGRPAGDGGSDRDPESARSAGAALYLHRKELQSRISQAKSRLAKSEARVAELEAEKAALLREIAARPDGYSRERNIRLDKVQRALASEEDRWMGLGHGLEILQSELADLRTS